MLEQTIIQQVVEQLGTLLNIPYGATFILLSYSLSKKFKLKKINIGKLKIPKTFLVFFIAFITGILFYYLSETPNKEMLISIIVTYTFGTSFYELIIKRIDALFNKKEKTQ